MYIEVVFLENFIINYILVRQMDYILRKKQRKKRVIVGVIIMTIYVIILNYIETNQIITKFCIFLLFSTITYVIYEPETINSYFKKIFLLTYEYILFSGITYTVLNIVGNKKYLVYFFSLSILSIINYLTKKYIFSKIKNIAFEYDLKIPVGKKEYLFKALVDSGNLVKYKNGKNVIFIEESTDIKKEFKKNVRKKDWIEIKTITGIKKIRIYTLEKIYVYKENEELCHIEEVPIAFKKASKKSAYNSIMSYDMYLEYIGGN